jgi:putative tricarboxylic transport membrane protein
VLGIAIMVGAHRLSLGGFHNPGPGLFPFILGLAIFGCSIPLNLRFLRKADELKSESRVIWNSKKLLQVGLVIISLLAYTFFLTTLGYLLTTFIVFFLIFKTLGSLKLRTILITLILMTTVSYYLFAVLLEVPLPKGILMIGIG